MMVKKAIEVMESPITHTVIGGVLIVVISAAIIGGVAMYSRGAVLSSEINRLQLTISNPTEGFPAIRARLRDVERALATVHANHVTMRAEVVSLRNALNRLSDAG